MNSVLKKIALCFVALFIGYFLSGFQINPNADTYGYGPIAKHFISGGRGVGFGIGASIIWFPAVYFLANRIFNIYLSVSNFVTTCICSGLTMGPIVRYFSDRPGESDLIQTLFGSIVLPIIFSALAILIANYFVEEDKNLAPTAPSSNLNEHQSKDELFEEALSEVRNGKQSPALWARCIAEFDGDTDKATGRYINQIVALLRKSVADRQAYSVAAELGNPKDDGDTNKKATFWLITPLGGTLLFGAMAAVILQYSGNIARPQDAANSASERQESNDQPAQLAAPQTAAIAESVASPVYVKLDTFTTSLAPESPYDGHPQEYVQVVVELKVDNKKVGETMRAYSPEIRNAILNLLSARKTSQLITAEGKDQLANDIVKAVNNIVTKDHKQGGPVTAVLFSSFIIQ